jgi:excisionase family DNA binding protein
MNYTVKEVARILRVCDRTVRNFIARGDLPAVRVGRKLLVSSRSVETFCRLRIVSPASLGDFHLTDSGDSHV